MGASARRMQAAYRCPGGTAFVRGPSLSVPYHGIPYAASPVAAVRVAFSLAPLAGGLRNERARPLPAILRVAVRLSTFLRTASWKGPCLVDSAAPFPRHPPEARLGRPYTRREQDGHGRAVPRVGVRACRYPPPDRAQSPRAAAPPGASTGRHTAGRRARRLLVRLRPFQRLGTALRRAVGMVIPSEAEIRRSKPARGVLRGYSTTGCARDQPCKTVGLRRYVHTPDGPKTAPEGGYCTRGKYR